MSLQECGGLGFLFSCFLGYKCVNVCFAQSIHFSIFAPCKQLETKARCLTG